MAKRANVRVSGLDRNEHDRYFTPAKLVAPLIAKLPAGTRFYEPCAGDGGLIVTLDKHGVRCVGASDLAPIDAFSDYIKQRDLFALREEHLNGANTIISNLPYGDPGKPRSRKQMHRMIEHLRQLKPTWLLLPLDWTANVNAIPLMDYASDVIHVRRWKDPGTASGGFFNFVWVRFQRDRPILTVLHTR